MQGLAVNTCNRCTLRWCHVDIHRFFQVRLSLGFAANDALEGAFAGPFSVGNFPLDVPFALIAGCSASAELDVEPEFELDDLSATFCFPAPAFPFALALFSSFSCSASFFWQAIKAFMPFPREGIDGR